MALLVGCLPTNNATARWKNAKQLNSVDAIVFTHNMPTGSLISAQDLAAMPVPLAALRSSAVPLEDAVQLIDRRMHNDVDAFRPVFWTDIEPLP